MTLSGTQSSLLDASKRCSFELSRKHECGVVAGVCVTGGEGVADGDVVSVIEAALAEVVVVEGAGVVASTVDPVAAAVATEVVVWLLRVGA